MTNQHPITPPPKLVQRWRSQWIYNVPGDLDELGFIATRAAQWGADRELEACCEWLRDPDLNVDTYKLQAARRPEPLSLKERLSKAIVDGYERETPLKSLEELND